MPRYPTGHVVVDERGESRRYALRFNAYGKRQYVALGSAQDGWSHKRAQLELENVLADIRRGIWRPAKPPPQQEMPEDPTFHEFATRWFEDTKAEWRPSTRADYYWQLYRHLLPFFKAHRLSEITIAEVDRYRKTKVGEARAKAAEREKGPLALEEYIDKNGRKRRRAPRPLSATTINKTITRLGQILEVALEYGLISSNPARGRRRRLRAQRPAPVWLDGAEHIEALLSAAGELDRQVLLHGGREHRGGIAYRRPLLATLVFAGLRIGELTALRWRDVDLTGARLAVRAAKTDAGMRQVDLLPALLHELKLHKLHTSDTAPDTPVFASAAGTEIAQNNIRVRVLEEATRLANERLEAEGETPLPEGLTPHKLRHTFASILVALGVDPGSVMDQIGHADPGFTLRVYRHTMRRDAHQRDRLRLLVQGAPAKQEPELRKPLSAASGGA